MREIKFRAWDETEMIYPHTVGKSEIGIDVLLLDGWATNASDTPLMQYTGLKDKNGVEIYEGDIVRTNGIDGELLWRIVWTELDVLSGFDYEPIGHEFSPVHNHVDEESEVIGNIYEHSHLLEANQ